ncbi:Histidinol phosphatase and related hydrolases of the PHP family [Archaeoglobus sulfaticallidus PM70-1]|uniref:Histidinol phosphatase and related hydrolases of the PHP family n=1 Tax=Archaeoglobus sulfaticallidus PM70-1 TaxID=387631 RepID=N0BB78_9EURY|nr:PHP domain-containing protein [Archaeoglobus sulfaticallidus]AGK60258.1 Histidinol phosphatase and related hydrolases of the PHP family [Archaeoglobus sulfaticallidus PM70-1]
MFDLHIHSNYSDGSSPIRDIAKKAKERNLKVIAIADHSMEHKFGLDEAKAVKRQLEIEKYSSAYNIEILSAVECGILADGEIMIPDFDFDIILASIHANISFKEYNLRVRKCIEKYDVDVIAHLYSEMFHPFDFQLNDCVEDALDLIDFIKDNDVAIELNTAHNSPPDEILLRCRRIKYSIGSDAHSLARIGDVREGFKKAKTIVKDGRFIIE